MPPASGWSSVKRRSNSRNSAGTPSCTLTQVITPLTLIAAAPGVPLFVSGITFASTTGADAVKVKGTITWVGVHDGVPAELRIYDRLFTEAQPDAGGRDYLTVLNPGSKKVVQGFVEPSLAKAQPDDKFQFERHGYFVADRIDSKPGKLVFNRITSLKDSWGK